MSAIDKKRYERNIAIEGFGEEGQMALKKAKTLVIGAGGLGSPVLYYLAAAGMGTLGIVDYDNVEISNLQRQIIHNENDIESGKATSAKNKIKLLNNACKVVEIKERFRRENVSEMISDYDFVVDCCDNYETKFLIDEICSAHNKPYCHGAVSSLCGEIMTWIPGHARYSDIFGNPPDPEEISSTPINGVLGSIAGIIGCMQATEAIKYFTGMGELILDRILLLDGETMEFRSLHCKK